MKSQKKILFYIIIPFILFSFDSNYRTFNENKVLENITLYVNNISKIYLKDNYYNYYGSVTDLFTEEITPIHFNDINPNKTESTLNDYLTDIETTLDDNVVVDITKPVIYSCPYYDTQGELKSYAIATCTKTININGNKTYYNIIIQLDLKDYKIFSVYSKESHTEMIPQCQTKEDNKEIQNQINTKRLIEEQAKDNFNKGENYFTEGKYIEAKRWYNSVLELVPNNLTAKDRIKDCEQLIDSKQIRERIESEILDNNFSSALELLKEIKNSKYVFSNDWFNSKLLETEKGLKHQKFNTLVSAGNYFYNNHMFNEAKKQYNKALLLHINDVLINNKIKLCNEGNPYYAKDEIRKAYNNAVKSKKNWSDTFKTYLKYEKSGFLTGEHYYFMTLMMLENKKVARKMGYSKPLANSLSIEYYFKAKRLGCKKCDMAFLENQVFTNSIYKH